MGPPEWVAGYVGLRFAEKGRDRDGVDCWGLARLVLAERFAVALPSFGAAYSDTGARAAIGAAIEGARPDWRGIAAGAERAGDVVLLTLLKRPVHIGLVVAPGLMLHVMRGIDSTVERYRGALWRRRVEGFYRPEALA